MVESCERLIIKNWKFLYKSRRIKSIVSLQIMVNRKQDILFIIMIYIMRILKEDVIRIVHGKMDSYILHQVEKRERIQMHC